MLLLRESISPAKLVFKIKKYFFMSAKRPRPTIPVLVHVENPTEAASVTVDTSTIEGQLNTVINNQEKIYDKIPTSGEESSADLTTVNKKTTELVTSVGHSEDSYGSLTVLGLLKNINRTTGNKTDAASAGTIKAVIGNSSDSGIATVMGRLNNISAVVGTKNETAGNGTINSHIFSIERTIGAIDDVAGTKSIKGVLGNAADGATLNTIMGKLSFLRNRIGNEESAINTANLTGLLKNIRSSIGPTEVKPSESGNSVRDLLLAIKTNTASSGGGSSADLTTVNENTTSISETLGTTGDSSSSSTVIGLLQRIIEHG